MNREIFAYTNACEEKVSYTWTLENFEKVPRKQGFFITGPKFSVNIEPNITWKIILNSSVYSGVQYLPQLVIQPESSTKYDSFLVKYIINLKNRAGNSKEVCKSEVNFGGTSSSTITAFFPEITTLKTEKFLEEDDALIVECLLTFVSYSNSCDISTEKICSEDLVHLSENFQKLYSSGNLSDFTVQVGNESINVHKCVLSSRSPVLAAMFDNETEENKDSKLILNDFDADTIKCLLSYLYTGQLDNITASMYFQLYSASDKYHVEALKKTCVNHILKILDVSNVCDVYALSYYHSDATLKTVANRFIQRNSSAVFKSESWEKILSENLPLATEIVKIAANAM